MLNRVAFARYMWAKRRGTLDFDQKPEPVVPHPLGLYGLYEISDGCAAWWVAAVSATAALKIAAEEDSFAGLTDAEIGVVADVRALSHAEALGRTIRFEDEPFGETLWACFVRCTKAGVLGCSEW